MSTIVDYCISETSKNLPQMALLPAYKYLWNFILYITVRLEHSHFSKISSSPCAVEMFKFFSVVFAEFYWTTFATTAKIIVSCSESINFEVYAHFLWKILTVDSTSSNTISSILRPSNKLIKNVRQVGSASNDCLDMESCLVLPRRHTRRRQSWRIHAKRYLQVWNMLQPHKLRCQHFVCRHLRLRWTVAIRWNTRL